MEKLSTKLLALISQDAPTRQLPSGEVWDSKNIFPKATTTQKQTAKRNTTLLHGG